MIVLIYVPIRSDFKTILYPDKYFIENVDVKPIKGWVCSQCKVKPQNWKVIIAYKHESDLVKKPTKNKSHAETGIKIET